MRSRAEPLLNPLACATFQARPSREIGHENGHSNTSIGLCQGPTNFSQLPFKINYLRHPRTPVKTRAKPAKPVELDFFSKISPSLPFFSAPCYPR